MKPMPFGTLPPVWSCPACGFSTAFSVLTPEMQARKRDLERIESVVAILCGGCGKALRPGVDAYMVMTVDNKNRVRALCAGCRTKGWWFDERGYPTQKDTYEARILAMPEPERSALLFGHFVDVDEEDDEPWDYPGEWGS